MYGIGLVGSRGFPYLWTAGQKYVYFHGIDRFGGRG
jgi:hypothetical protein